MGLLDLVGGFEIAFSLIVKKDLQSNFPFIIYM